MNRYRKKWMMAHLISAASSGGGGIPSYSDLIQLLSGVDGDELIDSLSPQIITPVPDVVQVPGLEMDGTDKITVVGLTGANVVTCDGTSTPTAGTGEITFTIGTVANIKIDGVLVYPCNEVGGATVCAVAGSWPDGILVATSSIPLMRAARVDGVTSWNLTKGYSPANVFDGVDDFINSGLTLGDASKSFKITLFHNRNASQVTNAETCGTESTIGANQGFVLRAGTFYINDGSTLKSCTASIGSGTFEKLAAYVDRDNDTIELFVDDVGGGSVDISGLGSIDNAASVNIGRASNAARPLAAQFTRICVEEEGVFVRDLIAKADGTFFDVINSVTYGNDGTGDFGKVEAPALADGSAAVDGNAITHIGTDISGALHNGATCKFVQSDTDMLPSDHWTDDNLSFVARTFAEIKLMKSGLTNGWLEWGLGTAGNCELRKFNQYGFAVMWLPEQYTALANYYAQGTCGGGLLVPAEVTPGTGIGPGGAWADNGDGKVLLVEDA